MYLVSPLKSRLESTCETCRLRAFMIQSTFILLKGVGEETERRFWQSGVRDWQTFLARCSIPGLSPERKSLYDATISSAVVHVQAGHSRYFSKCLKPRDHWRLFETFRSRAVYLDIETTGGPPNADAVTVVGLYANGHMTSLVQGESLTGHRLNQELANYDLLVTFFGSRFDLPYLRSTFPGVLLDHPHLDLCFAARRLGLDGGLKQIEGRMGIRRAPDLQGLDGWDAVRLWHAWGNGETAARDRLLRYNEADTRNLEPLAELLYDELVARYGPQG